MRPSSAQYGRGLILWGLMHCDLLMSEVFLCCRVLSQAASHQSGFWKSAAGHWTALPNLASHRPSWQPELLLVCLGPSLLARLAHHTVMLSAQITLCVQSARVLQSVLRDVAAPMHMTVASAVCIMSRQLTHAIQPCHGRQD